MSDITKQTPNSKKVKYKEDPHKITDDLDFVFKFEDYLKNQDEEEDDDGEQAKILYDQSLLPAVVEKKEFERFLARFRLLTYYKKKKQEYTEQYEGKFKENINSKAMDLPIIETDPLRSAYAKVAFTTYGGHKLLKAKVYKTPENRRLLNHKTKIVIPSSKKGIKKIPKELRKKATNALKIWITALLVIKHRKQRLKQQEQVDREAAQNNLNKQQTRKTIKNIKQRNSSIKRKECVEHAKQIQQTKSQKFQTKEEQVPQKQQNTFQEKLMHERTGQEKQQNTSKEVIQKNN